MKRKSRYVETKGLTIDIMTPVFGFLSNIPEHPWNHASEEMRDNYLIGIASLVVDTLQESYATGELQDNLIQLAKKVRAEKIGEDILATVTRRTRKK